MDFRSQSLEKIQRFVEKLEKTEYHTASLSGVSTYEAQLQGTLTELITRVEQEGLSLELLKSRAGSSIVNGPSSDANVRLQQLNAITTAYEKLTPLEPLLPPSKSSVPVLLAVRNARRVVSEIRDLIPSTRSTLSTARQDLYKEQSDLKDAALLASTLESRIAQLRSLATQKSEQTAHDIASNLISTEKERKNFYEQSTKALFVALIQFIDTTLAPLLAAEELGGPVAGSVLNIDEEALAAGYTARGKVKKSKAANEDKRQRLIDEVWGLQNITDEDSSETVNTETKAAARDMRALTENLLNVAVDQGAGAYVTLERESAAVRFLVRAKAASLHPRDARRIRLLDFGRTLDD